MQYSSELLFDNGSKYTSGDLSTILRYSSSLYEVYVNCYHLFMQFYMVQPEMSKIFEILLYKSKVKNSSGMIINDLKGDIEFNSVCFRYPGNE